MCGCIGGGRGFAYGQPYQPDSRKRYELTDSTITGIAYAPPKDMRTMTRYVNGQQPYMVELPCKSPKVFRKS